MYRFSREGREIAVISLFAAPFARVGVVQVMQKIYLHLHIPPVAVKITYNSYF